MELLSDPPYPLSKNHQSNFLQSFKAYPKTFPGKTLCRADALDLGLLMILDTSAPNGISDRSNGELKRRSQGAWPSDSKS